MRKGGQCRYVADAVRTASENMRPPVLLVRRPIVFYLLSSFAVGIDHSSRLPRVEFYERSQYAHVSELRIIRVAK